MVEIPTSRNVGYSGTRSGRIAPNGPTVSVGAAVANAGKIVAESAFDLQALAEREQADVMGDKANAVSTNLTRFLGEEEERFRKSQDESSESGIGFTRNYLEGWQQRADDFAKQNFAGLSEDEQTRYLNTLITRGNDLYSKADSFENKQKGLYYDRTTNSNLDTVRTQIRYNSADFNQLKQQGLEAIDTANMPESWKAARRQQWEADAAESKWRWKFQNAPDQALHEIRGTGGTDSVLAAMEDVESSGNPGAESSKGASGLMQVMPETGAEIARDLGDAKFPANGTVEEQKAYLKDPAVSRRYGDHYYNQMLTRYSGDREAALIAYNGGPTRADAWLAAGRDDSVIPKESADYYKKVLDKAKTTTFTTQDVSQAKVFLQSRTDKDASHIDGLDDGFSVKLARMFQAAPPEIQAGLGVYSGARSNERQAELWKEALAKYGSVDEARRNVAPPGHSNHNEKDGFKARAADVSFNGQSLKNAPPNVVKWVHENASNFGLKFPLANENWHIEDASTRGGKARPVDPDLDAIPYARREQLASWGETQYSQQRNQERAAAKDSYSLMIATQPEQMQESVILADRTIDNGDKAQLITSLRSALKETSGVNAFINAMGDGGISVNPFDDDQRKIADKAYEKMMGSAQPEQRAAVTSNFVASTGYIPQKVQAELRRGASSTDVAQVSQAMEAASVLQKNAPISFGSFDGSSSIAKNLDLYKTYTQGMGYTADEAAKKIIAANDPEQIRRRDAILKSEPVKKLLKDQSASNVAAIFDKGIFSRAPTVGASASQDQIKVGVNPEAEAAIVADYRSVLEEALVDANGDQDAAADIAKRRFQTVYGTTSLSPLSSNIVVKYPPEKAYPVGPDGTHAYIGNQLKDTMKAEGIEADAFYLQGDQSTEQDIKAGRPARYQVFYEKDGKLQRFNIPFYADVDAEKAALKAKQDETVREAEQRMLQNRAGILAAPEAPRGRSGQSLEGPPIGITTDRERFDKQFEGMGLSKEPRGVQPLKDAVNGAGEFFQGVFGPSKSNVPSRAAPQRKK
ncbi:soluble lytic murein transglycosylase-like protein [Neorhizobium sp. 2083]|uniref:transglycosylase SLT domain-containing protein n=1 Tax=Neorhizobium sp. 2083 TaxID=2817762 RepID=UPI00285B891D|nr:transglycosylase SLT domain-containing protein [Neorhizobium sp. 2083]MDR6818508.1 soluble lytic murein transglycosylase-like protein [Neorhizobium sp. 2083]